MAPSIDYRASTSFSVSASCYVIVYSTKSVRDSVGVDKTEMGCNSASKELISVQF
jgi:hypothetical protein